MAMNPIKEFLYHIPGFATLHRMHREWRFRRKFPEAASRESLFTRYYQHNGWGNTESASGEGSTLQYTANLRKELPGLLRDLKIQRLLDAPCGDFNWMQHVPREGLDYIGADIVEPLIAGNQSRFGDAHTRFQLLDIMQQPLPEAVGSSRVDLQACKLEYSIVSPK